VQTTSATEITCRVDGNIDPKTADEEGEMIVFLKTSEEAQCEIETCQWTWTDDVPEVTAMSTEFDTTADEEGWNLVIEGTGFTGDQDSVSLEVGGTAQTGVAVTATTATFRISDVAAETLTDLFLYFPVGLPAGHSFVAAGATLEPKLTQISPNEGSVGGTEITATVHGVGTATTGLQLVNANGESICQSLSITAYATVKCVTNAADFGAEAG